MASYKNRSKELERALLIISSLVNDTVNTDEFSVLVTKEKVEKFVNHVLKTGRVEGSGVTKTVRNLMSGKEIEVEIGTPTYLDPSAETYWSM